MSKGSVRRPTAVPPTKVTDNWANTFGARRACVECAKQGDAAMRSCTHLKREPAP